MLDGLPEWEEVGKYIISAESQSSISPILPTFSFDFGGLFFLINPLFC